MYKDGTLKKILLEKTKLKTKVIEQNRSSDLKRFQIERLEIQFIREFDPGSG